MKSAQARMLFLLVSGLTVFLYIPALSDFFVLDDTTMIFEGRLAQNLQSLLQLSPTQHLSERSFSRLTFWWNKQWWGMEAFPYHVVDLLLHLGNAALLFVLVQRLCRTLNIKTGNWVALLAAALFLIHPIQTQAVNYLSQRTAELQVFFNLIALWAYLRFRTDGGNTRTSLLMFAVFGLTLLLSLTSKPTGITLFAQVLALEVFVVGKVRGQQQWKWVTGWGVLLVLIIAIGMMVPAASIDTPRVSRWDYFLSQPMVVLGYLQLILLPIHLSFDHPSILWSDYGMMPVLLAIACHVVILSGAFIMRHRSPLIAFGLFLFYIGLSAESSLIPIRDFMVEHRTYLPMAGLSLVFGVMVAQIPKPRGRTLFALALIIPLGLRTYVRNLDWSTEDALWSATLSTNPTSGKALLYQGNKLMEQGQDQEALALFERALAHNPTDVSVMNSQALILLRSGDVISSKRVLERALELQPFEYETHLNLGFWYETTGKHEQAEHWYKLAMDRCPACTEAHLHLGTLLLKKGLLTRAERQLKLAAHEERGSSRAFYNLGYLHLQKKDSAAALESFKQALERDPKSEFACEYVASITLALTDHTEAAPYYSRLLEINPQNKYALKFFADQR